MMVDTTIVNNYYIHNTHFDTNLLKVSSHLLSFIDATLQKFGKPLRQTNPFYIIPLQLSTIIMVLYQPWLNDHSVFIINHYKLP